MIVKHGRLTLEYLKSGSGEKAVFCFHGVGRSGADFNFLERLVGNEYSVYAVNLFFHGESKISLDQRATCITNLEWINLFAQLLEIENISKFSILGYSMGARFGEVVIQNMPNQVERIVLAAPDGIVSNFWFRLSTGTRMGRLGLKTLLSFPKFCLLGISFLNKTGLMDDRLAAIAGWYCKDKKRTNQILNSWIWFRKIFPDVLKMFRLIEEYKIPCNMILGDSDVLVPYVSVKKKIAELNVQNVEIILVQYGHNLLPIGEIRDKIKNALLNENSPIK